MRNPAGKGKVRMSVQQIFLIEIQKFKSDLIPHQYACQGDDTEINDTHSYEHICLSFIYLIVQFVFSELHIIFFFHFYECPDEHHMSTDN